MTFTREHVGLVLRRVWRDVVADWRNPERKTTYERIVRYRITAAREGRKTIDVRPIEYTVYPIDSKSGEREPVMINDTENSVYANAYDRRVKPDELIAEGYTLEN